MRHQSAAALVERGVHPRTWQMLLSHKDLSQHPRYVESKDERAQAAVDLL